MKRSSSLRRTAMNRSHRGTGPSQDVVEAVYERAGWSCERCGIGVGPTRGEEHHIQHRRPRGIGGTVRPETNWPSNLLLFCPECHTGPNGVESRRAEAYDAGWLVHQMDDPAEIAVLIVGDRWVYLNPLGGYAPHPPRWKEPTNG